MTQKIFRWNGILCELIGNILDFCNPYYVLSCSTCRENGGKYCTLIGFYDNQITIRRPEGTMVTTLISPYPAMLYNLTSKNKWTQATQLCRGAKVSFRLLHKSLRSLCCGPVSLPWPRKQRNWISLRLLMRR